MKKNIIFFVIFALLIVIVAGYYRFRQIKNNRIIVIGIIKNKKLLTKSGEYYVAHFNYKGYDYISETRLDANCDNINFQEKAYGRKIFILIDSTNPSNNIMLKDYYDYKKYNLEYPLFLDSLQNCN